MAAGIGMQQTFASSTSAEGFYIFRSKELANYKQGLLGSIEVPQGAN